MNDIVESIADLVGMPVSECECGGHSLSCTKIIDSGDNIVWHWEFCPVASCEPITSGKVEKPMSALTVVGGSEADSTNRAFLQ